MGGANAAGAGGRAGCGRAPAGVIPNRNVDILFLIDDSAGMAHGAGEPRNATFPQFVTALEGLPGGLPDLHIAVVSSDMGAGDGSICGLHRQGQGRRLPVRTARGRAPRRRWRPGATYISNVGGVANYTGDLADVFTLHRARSARAAVASSTSSRAVARALGADGQPAPAENQGFLRPDASLFVVIADRRRRLLGAARDRRCSTSPATLDARVQRSVRLELSLQRVRPPVRRQADHRASRPTGQVTDTVTLDDCVPADGERPADAGRDAGRAAPRAQGRFPTRRSWSSAITGPIDPVHQSTGSPRHGRTPVHGRRCRALLAAAGHQLR